MNKIFSIFKHLLLLFTLPALLFSYGVYILSTEKSIGGLVGAAYTVYGGITIFVIASLMAMYLIIMKIKHKRLLWYIEILIVFVSFILAYFIAINNTW